MSTAIGELLVTILAGITQFERGLLRERINSGLENAKAKGKALGRPKGSRSEEKHGKRVRELLASGHSYREVAHFVGISKNTVAAIAKCA